MKSKKVLVLFLSSVIFSFGCYSMEQEGPVEKQGVRVAIFLEAVYPKEVDLHDIYPKYFPQSGEKVFGYSQDDRQLQIFNRLLSTVNSVSGSEYRQLQVFNRLLSAVRRFEDSVSGGVEVIVVSDALMYVLLQVERVVLKEQFKQWVKDFFNEINKKWFAYTTSDEKFAVFVRTADPKLEKIDWKKIGLKKPDEKNIILGMGESAVREKIRKIFVEKILQAPRGQDLGVDVESLNNIFKGNVKKFVFVGGHGDSGVLGKETIKETMESARIASLKHKQNIAFLRDMQKKGCLFMCYISCYIGGLNLKMINTLVDEVSLQVLEEKEKTSVDFPIVVAGVSDVTTNVSARINFAEFYKNLDIFFSRRLTGEGSSPEYKALIEEPFRAIVRPLCGEKIKIQNIPMVLLPGLDKPIKTIKVDKEVLVLTYPYLIKKELKGVTVRGRTLQKKLEREEKEREKREKKLRDCRDEIGRINELLKTAKRNEQQKLESKKTEIKKDIEAFYKEIQEKQRELEKLRSEVPKALTAKGFIEIGAKKAVLIYPMILNVSLASTFGKFPKIVSMLPGQAHHYIKKILAQNRYIKDVMNEMFITNLKLGYPKLFYIKEIVGTNNFQGSGILFPDNEDKYQGLNIKNLFVIFQKGRDAIKGWFQVKESRKEDESYHWVRFVISENKKEFDFSREKDLHAVRSDINEMFKSTKPFKSAMIDSSGGIESVEQFKDLVNKATGDLLD